MVRLVSRVAWSFAALIAAVSVAAPARAADDDEDPPAAAAEKHEAPSVDEEAPKAPSPEAAAKASERDPTDEQVRRGDWTLLRFRPPGRPASHLVVASAFDDDDPIDIHLSLDVIFETHSASLYREHVRQTPSAQPGDPLPVVRDLASSQTRQLLVPRAAVGIYHDLELALTLPVVLSDTRSISRDVPGADSPAVIDGLVDAAGFDAGANGPIGGGSTLFKGVKRSGLDQLWLGMTYALTNQTRDWSKPTWTVGLELRLSVGSIMKFDRQNPGGSTGVSRGVHELRASSAFARRVGPIEPRGEIWWMGPIGRRGDNPDDPESSRYWEVGFGQEPFGPRHKAGITMGMGLVAWESDVRRRRLVVDLDLSGTSFFEGRDYSEMWELLAYAGDAQGGGPLILDRDPVTAGVQPLDHPGVTNIENHLRLGGKVGATFDLGRLRLVGSFGYERDTRHHVTWTDAGKDGDDADDFITPNTSEINPLHQPIIDIAGRRYIAEGAGTFTLDLAAMFLF